MLLELNERLSHAEQDLGFALQVVAIPNVSDLSCDQCAHLDVGMHTLHA